MPRTPDLITLADLVRRAAAIVDPPGEDAAVEEFAVRFEDADQPVRGMLDGLEERCCGASTRTRRSSWPRR